MRSSKRALEATGGDSGPPRNIKRNNKLLMSNASMQANPGSSRWFFNQAIDPAAGTIRCGYLSRNISDPSSLQYALRTSGRAIRASGGDARTPTNNASRNPDYISSHIRADGVHKSAEILFF